MANSGIMIQRGILAVALFTLAVLGSPSHANGDQIQRGQAAAAACVACHQADGNGLSQGPTSWPRLAGLPAKYLEAQLQAFKSGDRESMEMKPFADMLNDDQVKDVSVYYASLPPEMPSASETFSDDMLAHGKQIALSGDWNRYVIPCISCHGPGNQGVGESFPGIAGQHQGYLSQQLHAWKDGTREGDPLGLMHAVADHLDDTDIDAVSAWLSTQPPASAQDQD